MGARHSVKTLAARTGGRPAGRMASTPRKRPVSLDHVSSTRRPAPPPLEGNDQLVTAVITVAWAVALIVVAALRDRLPAGDRWWFWTCVAGLGLGIFALWYVPRINRPPPRGGARGSGQAPGKP